MEPFEEDFAFVGFGFVTIGPEATMNAQGLVDRTAGHGEIIWPARAGRYFPGVTTATVIERPAQSAVQLTDSIPGLRPHIRLWGWHWRA